MTTTNLLLIDLSSIGHAMWHISANEPDPNAASTKTVERVRALASGQPHVAIALDSPPYFRTAISADYKATRAKDNNAVISHQLALAADTLRADGFPVWGAKGYEADDIIATAVRNSRIPDYHGLDVTIASADKDVLQLVSDHVSVKSLKDGSIIGPDEVKAKFGVWPHQIVDYLSLVGDTSDNIKGAEKIGPKRAAEVLELFGNLPDAIKAAQEGTTDDLIVRSLRDFALRAATVRELITLRTDAPIPFDEIFKERVPTDGEDMTNEHPRELPEDARETAARSGAAIVALASAPADRPGPQPDATAVVRPNGAQNVQRDGPDTARAQPSEGRQTVVPYVQPAAPPTVPDIISAEPVEWTKQLEPRSMGQAKQVAADLFASRMFSAYGNAPAVLSTIMAGRELGFQTMASLRAFHVIEGKPSLSAGAIHSLILTSGKAEYFRCVNRTPTGAAFETKRKGDPEPIALTFTLEEARQAWNGKRNPDGTPDEKSWAASGWGRNPADMCVARALTKLARLVYPDITHGLYSPEELS